MTTYYYKKADAAYTRQVIRFSGLGIAAFGLCIVLYIFSPMVSWTLFSAPVFFSQKLLSPIPQTAIVNAATIQQFFQNQVSAFQNGDSTNAANWFPQYSLVKKVADTPPKVSLYTLSIPKIKITNALVSTVDNDLSKHMVDFGGTAIPPQKGNAVIFAHSTLPQLFDPTNYKTILANAYKLEVGDEIIATINNTAYTYRVFSITVVEPDDTSVFIQNYDTSYMSLITCTPPGTLWHRLVVKARLEQSQPS